MKQSGRSCWVCGGEHSSNLRFEVHHIFGKKNSGLTVTLCKRCHNEVTHVQMDRSTKDLEQAFAALKEILEDRDWRVRMFLLKVMSVSCEASRLVQQG